MAKIRFALALHNHQPVGNFEGVFEAAYEDSYRPFLDVIEKYPELPFSLHTSGCLMEWLVDKHPEYIDHLRALVNRGQVEILGGGFYEPILPNIPSRDRRGQIRGYSEYLLELFGQPIRGMWVAERVWEQSLVSDIAASGIEYTILDDYHFQKAGLRPDQLHGYYLSEDEGKIIRIFPGSEPMRYFIPFQEPHLAIDYLRHVHETHPNALVVFADDGEKFGTWPETKIHVYENGWIYRFLDALRANLDWIEVCTLSQAMDNLEPLGTVYLPDCSYREMTEWALPAERLQEYDHLWHDLEHEERGQLIRGFLKGGFWRNFRVKYPESREMYARMMQVSQRLQEIIEQDPSAFGDQKIHEARQELYRGQCNCSYWHGAFGGLYLPHLRNAIYSHLIQAEKWLQAYEQEGSGSYVKVQVRDLNFDGKNEVRLENDHAVAFIAPATGGHLYELDIRPINLNAAASLARRPEAYHEKIRNFQPNNGDDHHVASIHDRVVFKQPGLDERLAYDWYERKSLIDHFFEPELSVQDLTHSRFRELGDFVNGAYEARVGRTDDVATLSLSRHGHVDGSRVMVTKKIEMEAGQKDIRIRYRVDNLDHRDLHFGIEFNFAAMAGGADDRYFHQLEKRLGRLDSELDLPDSDRINLYDDWLGLDVGIQMSQQGGIFTFPIQSVSQSEGGFELVHQSACVLPHWHIPASADSWEVELTLLLDTAVAQSRSLARVG